MYIIEICIVCIVAINLNIILLKRNIRPSKDENARAGLLKAKRKFNIRPATIIFVFVCIVAISVQFMLEKPKINSNIELNVGENIQVDKIDVKYHGKNIINKITIDEKNVNTGVLGEYTINIKVPYLFGIYSKDVVVKVLDKEAPVITLEYKDGDKVSYTKNLTKEGFDISDNYDNLTKENVKVEKNENGNMVTYKYSASDSSGNKTEKQITIEHIDDVAPIITLNGAEVVYLSVGEQYNEQGASANDEKDGDLTEKIETNSNVNTSSAGQYYVDYVVKDSSGNETKVTRTVKVNAAQTGSVIYLTFDDGPSNITPQILDILNKRGIKASFFILNYSDSMEYLVKRIVNEGHTIALHGYSHEYSVIYASPDAFMKNIYSLREKVKNSTGVDTNIIRFPGGSSNTVSRSYCKGIMSTLTKRVLNEGYTYFDWNVSGEDSGGANTPEKVYNNVISGLRHGRENVVLLHDAGGKYQTLNSLENIINYAERNGYTFSNITSATPPVRHSVNN